MSILSIYRARTLSIDLNDDVDRFIKVSKHSVGTRIVKHLYNKNTVCLFCLVMYLGNMYK